MRDGEDWQWPPVAHRGPKVMLINGWSGSGGDAFPFIFPRGEARAARRPAHVGRADRHQRLADARGRRRRDRADVPDVRRRGQWFAEGHGVEPDIKVEEDPAQLAKGTDPQLERAIVEALRLVKEKPPAPPARPAYEKRVPGK